MSGSRFLRGLRPWKTVEAVGNRGFHYVGLHAIRANYGVQPSHLKAGSFGSIIYKRNLAFGPFKKFSSKKGVVIDETEVDTPLTDLKHYLRVEDNTDLLKQKLYEYIDESQSLHSSSLTTINLAFLRVLGETDDMGVFDLEFLNRLFQMSIENLQVGEGYKYEYMEKIFLYFMKLDEKKPLKAVLEYSLIINESAVFEEHLLGFLRKKPQMEDVDSLLGFIFRILESRSLLNLEFFHKLTSILIELDAPFTFSFYQSYSQFTEKLMVEEKKKLIEIESATNDMVKQISNSKDLSLSLSISFLLYSAKHGFDGPQELLIEYLDQTLVDLSKVQLNEQILEILFANCIRHRKTGLGQLIHAHAEKLSIDQPNNDILNLIMIQWEIYNSPDTVEGLNFVLSKLEALSEREKEEYIVESDEPELQQQSSTSFEEDLLTHLLEPAIVSGKSEEYTSNLIETLKNDYGLNHNANSYALLLRIPIANNNPQQAMDFFSQSIQEGVSWSNGESAVGINVLSDLISLLANSKEISIVDVTMCFNSARRIINRVTIPTTASLVKRLLDEGYVGDAIAVLKAELTRFDRNAAVKLPIDEYRPIFDALNEFILTEREDLSENWEIYSILHDYFHPPEECYLPYMKFFTENDRTDAALKIFKAFHKLNFLHGFPGPSEEHYILLFDEFGKRGFDLGATEISAFVKTDMAVEGTLSLRNAMLNCYADLVSWSNVRYLWQTMISIEGNKGINNDTITCMLKYYTNVSLFAVQTYWDDLSTIKMLPTRDNFKQFLIAHSYYHDIPEAIKVAGEMKDYDIEMDTDILSSLYNYCRAEEDKLLVDEWANKSYPKLWQEIRDNNLLTDELPPLSLSTRTKDVLLLRE